MKDNDIEVISMTLKDIYNAQENGEGRSTEKTRVKGVYALYHNQQLKKIGKSTDHYGIFHRMSQYYRGDENGGSKAINENNRDHINIMFFTLKDESEIWYAERRLQVIAHDCGESMPWENTSWN